MCNGMSEPRISARISPKLRRQIDRAIKGCNQTESNFVRTAVEEFLRNHRTTEDRISAIVRSHMVGASK